MLIVDESGFTLGGVLDGQNRTFTTSRAMRTDLPVELFVNGDRMLAGLDDGFDVVDVRTVRLRLAPVALDTVAVKFSADPLPVGLLGGTPQVLQAQVLGSGVQVGAVVLGAGVQTQAQVVPDGTFAEVVSG